MVDYKNEEFRNRILNAIKNKKLTIFVGAGFSKLCGLPLWYDLGISLLDFCVKNEDYDFTAKDKELLLSSVKDSRELVTIASNIIGKKNKDAFYSQVIRKLTIENDSLSDTERKNYETLPLIVKNLANTIITTNADSLIDDQFDGESAILYTENDINKFDVKETKQIFHIHGSIKKPDDMVFSTVDYLKRYNLNNFSSKIKKIFNNPDPDSVILIIGYSLSELQLLDLIVKNDALPTEEREKKTFLINGYYSYQENVFEAEREYYKTYGISLLSYCKDLKGYQGLADALIEIKNMADAISAKEINQTKKVLSLFNSKPSLTTFDSFMNEFSEFDNTRRDFILNELKTSKWIQFWVKRMFDNKIFFEKYLNVEKNMPLILQDDYSFSCCRFITKIKLNELSNTSEIKSYFRSLLICFIEHNEYFTNRAMALDICRAIMTNVQYICMPEAYEFIELFNKQEYRNYWILFLCHDNEILLRTSKNVLSKYTKLVLENFYYNGDKDYYFELFYNTYGKRISSEIPEKVISMCETIINKEIKDKEKLFITRDTFEELAINKNDYYPINNIYKMFLCCLSGISDESAVLFYIKYKNKKDIFYKQLSIYLVNIKFNLLEQYLCADLVDYENDRKYFAEIYSCFKNNCTNISDEKIGQILQYIKDIEYDGYSEIWNITAKKYLLELFTGNPRFIENTEYKALCRNVENLIDQGDYRNSIKTMPSPNNMSKSVWSSVSSWTRDKTLFNNLKELDNFELFEKLKSVDLENFDNLDSVNDLLDLRIPNGFLEFLLNKNLISEVSTQLANLIIHSLVKLEKSETRRSLEQIIQIVESRVDANERNELKVKSFGTVYFIIRNIEKDDGDELLFNKVFNFALSAEFLSDDWRVQNEGMNTGINLVFTAKVFDWLNVLMLTCGSRNWSTLKAKYNIWLNDETKTPIAKASLVANMHLLWHYDENYVKNYIDYLFNNSVDNINYSYISFQLSMFYLAEFVNLLNEKNLIFDLLESKDFGLNWNYEYLVIWLYLQEKVDKNIIKNILNCSCSKHSIFSIVKDFEKYGVSKISPDTISSFFLAVSETKFVDADHCAVELYKLANIFSGYDYYVEALVSLFGSQNNGYYASELLLELNNNSLTPSENEKIIFAYLENLEDHYFYVDEIINLINGISWSSDNVKLEIINKLGKSNPIFLSKFDIK